MFPKIDHSLIFESMENSKVNLNSHLGILFYAIAMADKKIHGKEIEALKTQVSEKWMRESRPYEDAKANGSREIYKAFSQMQKTNAESDACFTLFREFYIENKSLFYLDLKKQIWEIAQVIAMSSSKKNKSELVLLAKLRILLQN